MITGTLLQPLYIMNVKVIMFNSKKLEEIAFAEDRVVIQMTYIYNYMSIQPFHFMALFSLLL